jgi:hypothetical protein
MTSSADPPPNAFDGNATTRWASGKNPQHGDEVFRLDLGNVFTINAVRLTSTATDFPAAYELAVSTDDASYTKVSSGLGAADLAVHFAAQPARYIRVKEIGTGYDHWWGINEIAVSQ